MFSLFSKDLGAGIYGSPCQPQPLIHGGPGVNFAFPRVVFARFAEPDGAAGGGLRTRSGPPSARPTARMPAGVWRLGVTR